MLEQLAADVVLAVWEELQEDELQPGFWQQADAFCWRMEEGVFCGGRSQYSLSLWLLVEPDLHTHSIISLP